MAFCGDAKLLFCILFVTCCCTVAMAQIPVDCCLSVVSGKSIDKTFIKDYRRQVSGQGCDIDAMILMTRRERTLCVTPGENWVTEVVKHVDKLRKDCKNNTKMPRCKGVRLV